ncbi:MAG TPA: type II toxin-antitoxin system RelE/ParE family toxin [Chthoniobacter sp.]|jgi:plasmid stabilization system protein ParE
MAWKVLIADSALADLREIVEFIAQDDPEAAERMGNRLVARALGLAAMPERHVVHDAARQIRKFPVVPYLVFYHCDRSTHTVSIIHFWHGSVSGPNLAETR